MAKKVANCDLNTAWMTSNGEGGGLKNTAIVSNWITVDNKRLENSIKNFWKTKCYETMKNNDPFFLPKRKIELLSIIFLVYYNLKGTLRWNLAVTWENKKVNGCIA